MRGLDDPMEALIHFNEVMATTMLTKRGSVSIFRLLSLSALIPCSKLSVPSAVSSTQYTTLGLWDMRICQSKVAALISLKAVADRFKTVLPTRHQKLPIMRTRYNAVDHFMRQDLQPLDRAIVLSLQQNPLEEDGRQNTKVAKGKAISEQQ